ncbi:ParM/StbA family protein [Anaerobacillus isosaccharinicus]|uniref:Actin-like protein N-terminal domain-containing protein n=1 Tax=Anaerobacillus isosaccharinicus TaxID=1532552 RepID=A0A1S2MD59_9BACI|nr:hypothetical protein [Anaerobacillus isosaccharinicus]MBA5588588.1 hypothetical protein [Anaerobacillus isosaccharinicus]QOY37998.1 hypothetical protein AWH56_010770 [Anaerobacillus isosaccharinicus]
MNIVGGDFGRRNVKIFTGQKMFHFSSVVGEARERNLDNGYVRGDLEVQFEGEKYYVGDLAERESDFRRYMMTKHKHHDDTKLLALTALHQAGVTEVRLITGLPVNSHKEENKKKLKQLLQDRHEITVNGEKKTIIIMSVDITVEGGLPFGANPRMD